MNALNRTFICYSFPLTLSLLSSKLYSHMDEHLKANKLCKFWFETLDLKSSQFFERHGFFHLKYIRCLSHIKHPEAWGDWRTRQQIKQQTLYSPKMFWTAASNSKLAHCTRPVKKLFNNMLFGCFSLNIRRM